MKGDRDAEVSDVYEMMCARFPSLETAASSLFIKSFSKTERWREALTILQNINEVDLLFTKVDYVFLYLCYFISVLNLSVSCSFLPDSLSLVYTHKSHYVSPPVWLFMVIGDELYFDIL